MVTGSDVGTDDAGDRTFIGQRQRPVTELASAFDQLLRMRRPAQEAEVGDAMQLGVSGQGGHDGWERIESICCDPIQRTVDALAALVKHMCVNHRCSYIAVP